MYERVVLKDESVHPFIKRAFSEDEVVVFWTNWQDRLEAMCGCGHTVCGYLTTRLPLPTPFLPHPCPCSHRLGRTVHILDERAVCRINGQDRLAAMCGCGHTVCGYLTTRLPLPTPFLPHPCPKLAPIWTNGTYSG
jgi:hypothetical protein